jgi:hypothetical protein
MEVNPITQIAADLKAGKITSLSTEKIFPYQPNKLKLTTTLMTLLADGLSESKSITCLDLKGIMIDEASAQVLITALQKNKTIVKIRTSPNSIGEQLLALAAENKAQALAIAKQLLANDCEVEKLPTALQKEFKERYTAILSVWDENEIPVNKKALERALQQLRSNTLHVLSADDLMDGFSLYKSNATVLSYSRTLFLNLDDQTMTLLATAIKASSSLLRINWEDAHISSSGLTILMDALMSCKYKTVITIQLPATGPLPLEGNLYRYARTNYSEASRIAELILEKKGVANLGPLDRASCSGSSFKRYVTVSQRRSRICY